jgi:hypothetical protein
LYLIVKQSAVVEGELFQKWLEELNASLRIGLPDFSQEILEKAPIKSSAVLPARTKEEQMQRNLATIEWLDKWAEEGDEEEQRETFEYLQKALSRSARKNKTMLRYINKTLALVG